MDKIVLGLVIVMVVMSFGMGAMWSQLRSLTKTQTATTPSAAQQPAQPTVDLKTIKALWDKNLIKFGDNNKKLLFVEIADPSCPYCHVAAGLNPELNAQMGSQFKMPSQGGTYVAPVPEIKKLMDSGQASLIWIYYPGHGNGEMGTKALYCAYEKGKFWEVHDKLFTNAGYNLLNTEIKNDKTKSQQLANFLSGVVDPGFLKQCLDSGKYDSRLNEDMQLATSLPFQGTPDFFVNTTNFGGAYSWTDMKSAVDAALK